MVRVLGLLSVELIFLWVMLWFFLVRGLSYTLFTIKIRISACVFFPSYFFKKWCEIIRQRCGQMSLLGKKREMIIG